MIGDCEASQVLRHHSVGEEESLSESFPGNRPLFAAMIHGRDCRKTASTRMYPAQFSFRSTLMMMDGPSDVSLRTEF
jgi:hypothetical protein